MANLDKRIARSIITVIFLTLITVVVPTISSSYLTPSANAATLDTSGMILNWDISNASSYTGQGATTVSDLTSNSSNGTVTQVGTTTFPTYTSAAPKYLAIAGNSSNYNHIKSVDLKSKLDQSSSANMQNISIFAWVYPTGNGVIVDEINADNGWQDSQIEMADGKFSFRVWGSSELISDTNSPLNYWYYVGLVYNFGTQTLTGFINGQQVGQLSGLDRQTPWETNSNYSLQYSVGRYDPTNLGSASGGNFRFGALHIFKTPLTAATIVNNYQAGLSRFGPATSNPSNATAWLNRSATFSVTSCSGIKAAADCTYIWEESIDGGSTWSTVGASSTTFITANVSSSYNGRMYRLTATDAGSAGDVPTSIRNYAVSSVATLTVNSPPGSDTDTAISLNGSTQYARVNDANSLDISDSITVEAWVYQSAVVGTDWNMVLNKESSYEVGTINGVWWYGLSGASWSGVNTGIKSTLNTWQHIALTRAAGSSIAKFYLNGVLVYSGTSDGVGTGQLANSSYSLTIGGRDLGLAPNNYAYFQGQIDEVRVFAADRSPTQISSDMHTYGPVNSPALRLYYDFNEGSGSTIYNRVAGALAESDLTLYNTPSWSDIKISDASTLPAYTIIKFPRSYLTSNGGWKVPSGVTNVSALIVAGGGGGGWNSGGGGGGGGFLYLPTTSISGTVTIKVGAGGVGAMSNDSGSTPTYPPGNGQSSIFISNTVAGGNAGGVYGVSSAGGAAITTATGSSGAGGSGPGSGVAAYGGKAGYQNAITGVNSIYSAGGGGGGFTSAGGAPGGASDGAQGGATSSPNAPGNGGGNTTANTGNNAATNTGSGGGASATHVFSGNGGSGVIIVRWITASKPNFTQPTIDTTTAGLSDTITVSANPIAPLARNYQWQSSSDTGTSWSNISIGTGAGINSQTYTTSSLESNTTGIRYQYRVIVTDSDTAGLSITDTSTAVYFILNPRITISGTYTILKYGASHTDTFTVDALTGTGNKNFTFAPNNRSGITWSSPSTNTATLAIASTLKPGTFYETITATDSRGSSTSFGVTIVVNKADTITVTALTASDTFTGSALAFPESYTVTGLVNSDTITAISWNYSGTQNGAGSYGPIATKPVNAGSYTMTPAPTILNSDSYTAVVINSAPLTINRATRTISISGVPTSLKFGSQFSPVTTASAGASDGSISLGSTTPDTCTAVSLNILALKSTGRCLFSATISRGANYETATTSSGSVNLGKAETITVTVNPITPVTYTGNSASITPTVTVTGLVNSNTVVGNPVTYSYLTQPTQGVTCATGGTCVVGDIGPGGGYVFYVASSQQSWGTYLEAAPANWSGNTDDAASNTTKWCIATSSVDGTKFGNLPDGIGQGYANTYNSALNVCTGGAIYKARNYRGAGLSDWYLPTSSELAQMATTSNRTLLGLVNNPVKWGYWGSDENSLDGTIGSLVTNGWHSGWTSKSESSHNYLRPIRAFSPIVATPVTYSSPPIDADTYTVQASALTLSAGSLSDYKGVSYVDGTLRINRALQSPLQIAQYGAILGTPYKLIIIGGSGTGDLTETVSAGSALGCTISGETVTSTTVGTCFVTATKSRDKNYETATASIYIYFLNFIIDQPSPAAGSGSTIALSGATSVTRDPNAAPNISSLSTYTATAGVTQIVIYGGGFDHLNPAGITVEFWRGVAASGFAVGGSDDQITVTVPADATTGKVLVITPNGTAVSAQGLTITP